MKQISVVVQARLGSQRVPRKMIRPFAGTTLVDILLEKLCSSSVITPDQVYFAVGEGELINIGKKYPVNIHVRSKESLESEGDTIKQFTWRHEMDTDHVVMVSACNPLLKIETIDKFIKEYQESEADEGAISVYETHNYYWNPEGKMLNKWPEGFTSMNTKFVEPTRVAAHTLYGSRIDLLEKGFWVTDKIPYQAQLITMPEIEAFDIDEPWQFTVAEKLYNIKDEL